NTTAVAQTKSPLSFTFSVADGMDRPVNVAASLSPSDVCASLEGTPGIQTVLDGDTLTLIPRAGDRSANRTFAYGFFGQDSTGEAQLDTVQTADGFIQGDTTANSQSTWKVVG